MTKSFTVIKGNQSNLQKFWINNPYVDTSTIILSFILLIAIKSYNYQIHFLNKER